MKDGFIKVAAVSPSLRVADTAYNSNEIIRLIALAEEKHVKVLVFPELSVTGYTCGDLFFQRSLLSSSQREMERIVSSTEGSDILVFAGCPVEWKGKLYNCAAAIQNGRVLAYYAKKNLPTYAEFYETRWFTPCPDENIAVDTRWGKVPLGNRIILSASLPSSLNIACEICEDLWVADPPSTHHAMAGATLIVNLSASDELVGKEEYRRSLVGMQSARTLSAYIYADASEGESTQDMVFTGSDIISENGVELLSVPYSLGELLVTEIDTDRLRTEREKRNTFPLCSSGYEYIGISFNEEKTLLTRKIDPSPFVPKDDEGRFRRCLKILTLQAMGLRRRLEHIHSEKCVIGLSGGLDSTLAFLVAVKAFDSLSIDRHNILAVTMPCFGTTKRTRSNAEKLASALGTGFTTIDITESVRSHFRDIGQDENDYSVTYENSQARERTQVLMDMANRLGAIVIGTGDLSELALGWATYNGDHMSMYGVNAGVPKTLVRSLVRYYAENECDGECRDVLLDILDTPVSPELIPGKDGNISQVTEDIVGPYELHDFFLHSIVRQSFGAGKTLRLALVAFNGTYDGETVYKWLRTFIRRFFSQQFKRSCLPDGPKVGAVTLSPRSDWRMPSDASCNVWLEELEKEWNECNHCTAGGV